MPRNPNPHGTGTSIHIPGAIETEVSRIVAEIKHKPDWERALQRCNELSERVYALKLEAEEAERIAAEEKAAAETAEPTGAEAETTKKKTKAKTKKK